MSSNVRCFRTKEGGLLDKWWKETDNASTIAKEVLTAYVLNNGIPQKQNTKKEGKAKQIEKKVDSKSLNEKLDNIEI